MQLNFNSWFKGLGFWAAIFFAGICVSGCATDRVRPAVETEDHAGEKTESGLSPVASDALERLIESVESDVSSNETSSSNTADELAEEGQTGNEQMAVELNRSVQAWIEYFTVRDRERFQRFLNRGEAYRSVVQTILRQNDVPPDLYYLAMIESGYSTHAYSTARAVGAWQFMRGTARLYGLEVNNYVDERRDPIRATEAAAKHLNDLYENFQSWYLAMAAYNAGERRIQRAIKLSGTRNYWAMVERKYLPRETRNYVPKFIAAVIIGRNLEKYGFSAEAEEVFPSVEAVELPTPIRLSDVASLSGIPLGTLERVNPHLRKGVTPPGHKAYEIWIPKEKIAEVGGLYVQLDSMRVKAVVAERALASSDGRGYYRVRRGDTLSGIARRFSMSIGYLKRLNGTNSSRIFPGQKLRVRARSYEVARVDPGRHYPRKSRRKPVAVSVSYYKVKHGDNLFKIARRFGMSVDQIKDLNGLRRGRIYAGQRLKVQDDG